jgi:phage repressor protein C with HTH and peptisase S24 domain
MTERIPWGELWLAELVGREVLRDATSPIWQHEAFVAWVAEEARAYSERHRTARQMDDGFLARGRDLRARVLARRLGVRRLTHAAPMHEIGERTSVAQVLERAPIERVTPVIDLGVAAGVGRELWDEAPDQWAELPSDVPDDGRYLAFRIVGDSMAPVMHTGDVVLTRVGPEVKADTVIVARHPDDGYVCKRVSSVRRRAIELASLEPWRPLIVIPRDPALVVGTVLLVWCTHRMRAPRLASV